MKVVFKRLRNCERILKYQRKPAIERIQGKAVIQV